MKPGGDTNFKHMNIKENKDDLLERVKKAKLFLRHHKISKDEFFDKSYGAMYNSEHDRVANLWRCKITDEYFTDQIENFASNPTTFQKNSAEFERMMRFIDWYVAAGGPPLTIEQIENVYPKFKY